MRLGFQFVVVIAAASASPYAVVAQEVAAPATATATQDQAAATTPPSASGCELHVWPAQRMSSATTGMLGGGLLDAMLHAGKDASNKTKIASALDSPTQLDALHSIDLVIELGLTPGTTIVNHDTPLDRHTMNKVKTRRADSRATCYAELIVADVAYQKAAIYGRSLRTLFMVRDFGADQTIDREYKAWGGNGLKLFPPKEGEDSTAALQELVDVFKKNFDEFAANERKSLNRQAVASK